MFIQVELPDPLKIDALHAAEVFVMPSRVDSFGIVYLEAWACGGPVVAADMPTKIGVILNRRISA